MFEAVVADMATRLNETGILPLKIQLPNAGTVHRFNRLMTTQEALSLEATFVHVKLPFAPVAMLGCLMLPIGGVTLLRLRRP